MDLAAAIQHVRPGEPFTLYGNDLNGLVWHADTTPPTMSEVRKAWPAVRDRQAYAGLRAERDALLAASDWTQVPDAPVDAAAWAKYRQALRDLPATTKDPASVKWPKAPA